MLTAIYCVVAKTFNDNDKVYKFASKIGAELVYESKISRLTHYRLSEDQAKAFSELAEVQTVIRHFDEKDLCAKTFSGSPYTITGDFSKLTSSYSATDYQWGALHCAGNNSQRRKGTWGEGAIPLSTVSDTVNIFNDGKDVDIVVMDDVLSYDIDEWLSPTTGLSRFVQYQWFDELSPYLGFGAPTGTVTYWDNATAPSGHGNHVAATIAGKHYGWAKEANIYSIPFPGVTFANNQSLSAFYVFDYVAAFHRYKPINPNTGRKNPTICNMSWGYFYTDYLNLRYPSGWTISDITQIYYDGVLYNSSNPGPSGWTAKGIEADFGISPSKTYVLNDQSVGFEVESMINEGVIAIGAAGNSNNEAVAPTHPGFDDYFMLGSAQAQVYYRKGPSPAANSNCLCVGALSQYSDFRRAFSSTFGERIDSFAPGSGILSAYNTSGIPDTKYGGDNYYVMADGTSFASPQIAGIAALIASKRPWTTQTDLIGYLKNKGRNNDMTFDAVVGGPTPTTYNFTVLPDSGGLDWTVNGIDADGNFFYSPDPTITLYEGDTIEMRHSLRSSYTSMNSAIGTSGWDMTVTDPDYNSTTGLDLPITIDEGDTLTIEILYAGGGHPIYIRSILGDPASNLAQVTGQGAEQQYDGLSWTTQIGDAGTYYYQCANHPNMYGVITVNPAGTAYNNPLYFKTQLGTGTGNQVVGASNQGSYCYATGSVTYTIPPGGSIFYYTHENILDMAGIVDGKPLLGVLGQTGNYLDPTCSKESPNNYPLCVDPRNSTGYIDDATYNIRETTGVQYPRRKIMFKQ